MKLTSIQLILSFVALFIFSSCGVHRSLVSDTDSHHLKVVLDEANYKIIKYVEGDAVAHYFMGMGDISRRALIAEARRNMLEQANLQGTSRVVINETVEMETRRNFLSTDLRCIVSAYVVEFYDQTQKAPQIEENVYASNVFEVEPVRSDLGVSAGINIQEEDFSYNTSILPYPGYHLGFKAEFSKPNTLRNFFWETQLNMSFLSNKQENTNWIYFHENIFMVDVPILAGIKVPFSEQLKWFIKGGPNLGIAFYNQDGSVRYEYGWRPHTESGSMILAGIEIQTGFQLFNRFQLGFGHRWMLDYNEFSSTNISLSYLF